MELLHLVSVQKGGTTIVTWLKYAALERAEWRMEDPSMNIACKD